VVGQVLGRLDVQLRTSGVTKRIAQTCGYLSTCITRSFRFSAHSGDEVSPVQVRPGVPSNGFAAVAEATTAARLRHHKLERWHRAAQWPANGMAAPSRCRRTLAPLARRGVCFGM